MSLPPIGLSAIHRVMADPITYTGAGLTAGAITGIHSEVPADQFAGPGNTAKHVTFEIPFELLPGMPAKGDRIVHATGAWKVIERDRAHGADAWLLSVEATAP
jgi:hypothetical protein